jgi:multidrug efflux pump subunit AcrB
MDSIVRAFVDSKLTPLIVLTTLLLGAFAILATPREEEPQIIVPMMDVLVEMPGASVKEVEERVTIPLEKKLAEIPGVEYLYSTSLPGLGMVIVRFYVGEDEEDAIVKLYNKLYSNLDLIPPGASQPIVKPRSIDDVPILALTLWSERYDHYTLRRIAAQLDDHIRDIQDVSVTTLIGGQQRQLTIRLDPAKLTAFHIDPLRVVTMLRQANREETAGSFARGNTEYLVKVGEFLQSAEEVGRVVVGAWNGTPVYLQDVAAVQDGPEETKNYVLLTPGPAASHKGIGVPPQPYPAVTLAVAKRKGTNAVTVAERVLEKVEALTGLLIPAEVHITVTRNYGETAQEKSNELLEHLLSAVISVTALIALFLGLRAALVVLIAVPATLALTLFIYYPYGYTLNRVTLFALIFSIGILVDDPIVDVENIVRHYHLPENRGRSLLEITVEAVNEVRSPLILATLAVIFAIMPMAFVRGLMGPYMRPIPVGASTAMLFSMAVAFVVTPWAAYRLLPHSGHSSGGRPAWLSRLCPWCGRHTGAEGAEGWTTRLYRRLMMPLIHDAPTQRLFLAAERSSVADLQALKIAATDGKLVPLAELVHVEETAEPPFIYRKNLKRVVYVTGDVAGAEESPVYAILKLNRALEALPLPEGYKLQRYVAQPPFFTEQLSLKWDGEWQITYEVFRDLGLAFAAVLTLIYVLVVAWFQSFKTPLVILAPIPLSLVGIVPAHGLLGAFFTATSMIGFIAGAGIVVRNSIILVDFVELRRRQGMALAEAVIDAGAVRFRPMLLTASAVVVGSAVMLFDPIFQGLAISLMAGEVASTFLSRLAVPVLYYRSVRKQEPQRGTTARLGRRGCALRWRP